MRVVVTTLLLATLGLPPGVAGAKRHHRRSVALATARPVRAPTADRLLAPATTAPPRANLSPSFVEFHTARVKNDLMMFHPDFPNLEPAIRRETDRAADTSAAPLSFVTPPRADDLLELTRRRDRLLLFRGEQRTSQGTALGLGVFSAMTVMAAHLPPPLRVLFDRRIHLGPAIFDDGGMGAGVAGAGL